MTMRFGAGKPQKNPSIDGLRELTPEDLANYVPGKDSAVAHLADSHHRMARLVASGLRTHEVAEASGYSITHVSIMKADPSFQELVAVYREQVDEEFKDAVANYYSTITATRMASARLINDTVLAAEPGDIPLRTLVAVHADTADRTGFGKRQTLDVNVDFAARLDKAIKRTEELRALPAPDPSQASGGERPGDNDGIVDAEFKEVQRRM